MEVIMLKNEVTKNVLVMVRMEKRGGDDQPLDNSIDGWMSNPLQPVPELGDEFPNPEDPVGELPHEWSEEQKKLMNQLNQKWRKHYTVCTKPISTQNLALVEPLAGRSTAKVLDALQTVHARFRAIWASRCCVCTQIRLENYSAGQSAVG